MEKKQDVRNHFIVQYFIILVYGCQKLLLIKLVVDNYKISVSQLIDCNKYRKCLHDTVYFSKLDPSVVRSGCV